jgi:hypothetical protein
MRDQRGYNKPTFDRKGANQPVDLSVPGSGGTTQDYGVDQLDNRSAAHYAEAWPGKRSAVMLRTRRTRPIRGAARSSDARRSGCSWGGPGHWSTHSREMTRSHGAGNESGGTGLPLR